jgi:activator of Hsp90 ATPase-like protein
VVTTTFVEKKGKTTMTINLLYESQAVRDAVVRSGMEHGAAESYDRLAEFLTSSAQTTAGT